MPHRPSYRIPNLVIGGRVALAFVAIGLLSHPSARVTAAGAALILVVLAMDALDGMVARSLGLSSRFGAVLDITADRIVEHVFWIFFAVSHLVGVWAPLVVVTRSFIVDSVRALALAQGKTAFGADTMMRSSLSRLLTGSRLVRNLYGGAKAAAFVLLGSILALERAAAAGLSLPTVSADALGGAAQVAVFITITLCVVRGIPVVLDSRPYLFGADAPTSANGT